MSYYKTWMELSEDNSNQQAYIEYVKRYYAMEKNAYEIILSAYPDNQSFLEGKAKDMALKLGFTDDTMDIFVGFLDGIKSSLTNADDLDLEAVVDDTDIKLVIDYEKLYYNMRDAKADWLYQLPMWDDIFDKEKQEELYKVAKKMHTVVKPKKIGRNDPCPCGSGRKFKQCHGKGGENFYYEESSSEE